MTHGGTYRAPGQVLGGRYRLDSQVPPASGAATWAAVDTWSGGAVLLHRLGPPPRLPPAFHNGWFDQATNRARQFGNLRDQHQLAVVSDVVPDGGELWSVTDRPAGRSLADTVRATGPIPPDQVRAFTHELLDGLRAGHELGLTHGGVNPDSVFVTPQLRPVLLCAGVVADDLAVAARLLGYRSPEQLGGGRDDPATDVFAAGAVAYFAAEGRGPFDRGDDPGATSYAVTNQPAAPPVRAGALAGPIASLLTTHRAARPTAGGALGLFAAPPFAASGFPFAASPAASPFAPPPVAPPPVATSPFAAAAVAGSPGLPPPAGYGGYPSGPPNGPAKPSKTPLVAAALAVALVVISGAVLAVMLTHDASDAPLAAGTSPSPAVTGPPTGPSTSRPPSRSPAPGPTEPEPSETATADADDYAPALRQQFLSSCIDASEGARDVCECTLDELEAQYTQEEFVEFGLDPDSPESQEAITSAVLLCTTTTDA